MKVGFLSKGGELARRMIRLFGYEADEVNLLRLACLELAYGRIGEFALHEQPWCRAVGNCRLVWRTAAKDVGIRVAAVGEAFVLEHAKERWLEVEGKLWPFPERSAGFNLLTNEGDVSLLIS